MRKFLKKISKVIIWFLATTVFAATIIVCAFFNDTCRQHMLNYASSAIKSYGIEFKIQGLDEKLRNIQSVFIKIPNIITMVAQDVNILKSDEKYSVSISKFNFQYTSKESYDDSTTSLTGAKNYSQYLKYVYLFVKNIAIKTVEVNYNQKKYAISNLKFTAFNDKDEIDLQSSDVNLLHITLHRKLFIYYAADVEYKKLFGVTGTLRIERQLLDNYLYNVDASKDKIKICSSGTFSSEHAAAEKIEISINDKKFQATGKFDFNECLLEIYSDINIENTLKTRIPDQLQYLRHLTVVMNCKINEKNYKSSVLFFNLSNSNELLATVECSFTDNCISVKSKQLALSDIYNYKLRSISADISNNLMNIVFAGDDFQVDANYSYAENTLNKCKLNTKGGYIKLKSPCVLGKNISAECEVKYKDLSFWKNVISVTGGCIGSIKYNNNIFSAELKSDSILYDNHKFESIYANISGSDIKITAHHAIIFDSNLDNLAITVNNNAINLKGNIHSLTKIEIIGTIDKNQTIVLNKFDITTNDLRLEAKDSSITINKLGASCKLFLDLKNNKNQSLGSGSIAYNQKSLSVVLYDLSLSNISSLLNKPHCNGTVSGKIDLIVNNAIFKGTADIIVKNLISKGHDIQLNADFDCDGIKAKALLKADKEELMCSIFVPTVMCANFSMQSRNANTLCCDIFGKMHIENILELSDQVDLRGLFEGNLHITGTLANPKITGAASLKNTYFLIYGVMLKNGTITLLGNGKNGFNVNANFIDSYKKSLDITGCGTLNFNGIIPNLHTDLNLAFNNYRLVDSDNLTVVIKGNGSMFGPITNLKITGDIKIPLCEINNLTNDTQAFENMVIEDEKAFYANADRELKEQKDNISYNVTMDCDNIKLTGGIYTLTMKGHILLTTYNQLTTLEGKAHLKKGHIDFFGKRLNFIKGEAEFFKEYPFAPKAHLSCNQNFGNLAVAIDVKNSPTKGCKILLNSIPNRTQDTILSNILFGKDTNNLGISEAAQLATAVNRLNGKGGVFALLNTFTTLGIFDSVSISNSKHNQSGASDKHTSEKTQTNISAGKYINDRVYVSVNKDSESTSLDIDYAITPSISAKANTNGEAGISWKYRY